MSTTSLKSKTPVKIALIKSDMISEFEIEQILGIIDGLGYKDKKLELHQLEIDNLSENEIFDVFLCISDDDVLNIARVLDNLPPLLCIELPGDNSFFSQAPLTNLKWALEAYLENEYALDSRTLLQLKTSKRTYNALNDVHITSSAINKRIRYDIRVNNESLYADNSDSANAILISTPTGSTAMSFNLGGALINPQSPVFQIISVASRNISTNHQIVPEEARIEVEITESILPLVINVDNYQFKAHDELLLFNKAPHKISFISYIEKKNHAHTQNKLKAKLSFEDTQSLTSTAKFILYVLKNNDKPFSINELKKITHIQNQKTLRSAINLLISKGFVKRRENLTDMREYLYYYSLAENTT